MSKRLKKKRVKTFALKERDLRLGKELLGCMASQQGGDAQRRH